MTQQHIDDGERGRPSHCPVALALRGAGYTDATIYRGRVYYSGRFYAICRQLSRKVMEMVADYDTGAPMHPFTIACPSNSGHFYLKEEVCA